MPALAMTDHGNLFGAINFYKACKKAGIRPLIGCEIYLVYDHSQEERPKRDRQRSDDIDDIPEEALGPEHFPRYQIHHKTLIAKNFKGYQNLVKLVSDAHVNGQYYRPRTDMDKLAQHSEGIIGLSGCINGVASQYLLYNDESSALAATERFIEIFGKENYYIEIQNHGMPAQQRILPKLVKIAKAFDLPLVAANDVHYVYRDDWKPHDSLLCIQTGKRLSDTDRMRYPNQEFYLKSREEMQMAFPDLPEALDNTLALAEQVDLDIPFGIDHYPVFERPETVEVRAPADQLDRILNLYISEKNKVLARDGKASISLSPAERAGFRKNGLYLLDLCKEGLGERYGVDFDELRSRHPDLLNPENPGLGTFDSGDPDFARKLCDKLEYELAIITGTGFVDYFLITWDFIHWARQQKIPVGPGRGSGAGSLIAYILKITDIEPLRFGLLFERMLSLERVSPPDFDVDFCMRRRDDVVDYVREKYGADRVANIITYGTFGAKMVVRDLARVMNIEYGEANRIAKMVPDDLNISLQDAIQKSSELRQQMESDNRVQEIIRQGKVIEGMVRNTGKHACGIIVGDQPLTNLVPVTLQEGDLTTQYAKGPVEELGMLKCDFLGLKTLTVIADAQDHIRRIEGMCDFDIEKVDLEDSKTYDLLNSGHTTGVFQLESSGMQTLCRQIGLSRFEEIIALIALYRPGPMQFIPQFVECKKDPSKLQVPHPLLKNLVEETYGVLVYQEQVMEAARIISGYTLGDADLLRRAMGKKIPEIMARQMERFVAGAKETNGIDEKTAKEIFSILEKFAKYGFNKSHSAAYAMLSYRTAYLKANYPVEFMAGVLGCELGKADKVAHFIDECNSMGIPVLGPDINGSRKTFTPSYEGNVRAIRFGLAAIKGVGDGPASTIIEERETSGPFESFRDFVQRVDSKSANRRILESLIRAGAFDSSGEDRAQLLADLDSALREVADRKKDEETGQQNMFDLFGMDTAGESPARKSSRPKVPAMSMKDKLASEKELLGFYLSGHPMQPFRRILPFLNTFEGDDYLKMEDKQPFRIAGVITGVDKKLARKDNRPWAIVDVATLKESFSIRAFANCYAEYAPVVEEGKCVIVEGQILRRDRDDVTLTANSFMPIESSLPPLVTELTFYINNDSAGAGFVETLRGKFDTEMGETPVRIAVVIDQDQAVLAEPASSLKWNFTVASFNPLARHPGVRDFHLRIPDPVAPQSRWAKK